MTKIIQKSLPNGVISTGEIANPQTKRVIMLLNENIKSLATQLAEAQQVLLELQGKTRKTQEEIDVDYVLQTASKDATVKANAAQTAAVATAAADATAKANAAQTAAVATAAADATVKVDAHANNANLHVTAALKNTWNAKYTKPTSGIPKTDLASEVQTALTSINSKITYPSGGSNGAVLIKSGTGTSWSTITVGNQVATKLFSGTSGNINLSSSATMNIDVSWSGYTPILVGNVACEGTNTSVYDSNRACVCTNCSLSGTTVSLTIRGTSQPLNVDQTANISFMVLYTKNS